MNHVKKNVIKEAIKRRIISSADSIDVTRRRKKVINKKDTNKIKRDNKRNKKTEKISKKLIQKLMKKLIEKY